MGSAQCTTQLEVDLYFTRRECGHSELFDATMFGYVTILKHQIHLRARCAVKKGAKTLIMNA